MRASIATALTLLASSTAVCALSSSSSGGEVGRHHRLIKKRCTGGKKHGRKQTSHTRLQQQQQSSSAIQQQQPELQTTAAPVRANVKPAVQKTKTTTSTTTTSAAAPEQTSKAPVSSGPSGGKGLIGYSDSKCGPSGATEETTAGAGPNGAQSWLNCGISSSDTSSPWTPPHLTFDMIEIKSLTEAVEMSNSVFGACAPYLDHFNSIGNELGIPPIALASIAMQESSCNPDVTGGGGEQGMFQITNDKCGGAPGGNCKDVHYNIRTGAEYLASTLKDNDGDLLLSLGQYNGWHNGLSYYGATTDKIQNQCGKACQNNLDYHQQMLNGWLLGKAGWELGTIKNLQ